jgi:hypothetical protein
VTTRAHVFLATTIAVGALAGCGGNRRKAPLPARLPDIAGLMRLCGEPGSTVVAEIDATLKVAEAHGLHGTPSELATGLYSLANYLAGHKERIRCSALLRAIEQSAKEPPKERACYRYGKGHLCLVPPTDRN